MIPEILFFIEIKFLDILDILLVAFLLFELYNLLKGTVAINIFIGIVAFYLLWKLVTALDMRLLSEIFGAFISVGFIALIVVFQPEIRKFLLLLGKSTSKSFDFLYRSRCNHILTQTSSDSIRMELLGLYAPQTGLSRSPASETGK